MKFGHLASFALTALSVSAAPPEPVKHKLKRDDAPPPGLPKCDHDVDRSSPEGVKTTILDYTGAMSYLDITLNTRQTQVNWLHDLWTTTFPKDKTTSLDSCGNINTDCHLEKQCDEYPNAMAYWVFESVKSIHDKVQAAKADLLEGAFLQSLSIDQMAKDFSPPKPDSGWVKWVAAAFTLAGNLATAGAASAGTSSFIGAASTAFSNAPQDDTTAKVDTTSVQSTLKSIIKGSCDYLDGIMQTAIGLGNRQFDKLPIMTESTLHNPIARFFSDPSFLVSMSADNSSLAKVYDNFASNIGKRLVDISMSTAWYVLLGDTDIREEGKCTGKGSAWLEGYDGQQACFSLVRHQSGNGCKDLNPKTCDGSSKSKGWQRVGDDIYDKLGTYGFSDLKAYYQSLIDCHLHGTGGVDPNVEGVAGSKIPRCYYDLYVRSGFWGSNDAFLFMYNGIIKVDAKGKMLGSSRDDSHTLDPDK